MKNYPDHPAIKAIDDCLKITQNLLETIEETVKEEQMSEEEDILKNMKNGVYFAHDGQVYQTEFGCTSPVRFAVSDDLIIIEWISTNERLPPHEVKEILTFSKKGINTAKRTETGDNWLSGGWGDCDCWGQSFLTFKDEEESEIVPKITYWMELPKEPE